MSKSGLHNLLIYIRQAEAEVVPSSSLVEVGVEVEVEVEVGVDVELEVWGEVEVGLRCLICI